MVAIRPPAVKGTSGQKFVVTRRFSGDGYEFKIGDVIVARPEWVHKVPQFVDQRFISPFLSEEDEQKVPVNLELAPEPIEVPPAKAPRASKTAKVQAPAKDETAKIEGQPEQEGNVDENEIDELAKSLLT